MSRPLLSCTTCPNALEDLGDSLLCRGCGIAVPVLSGIPVFGEARLVNTESSRAAWHASLVEKYGLEPGRLATEHARIAARGAGEPVDAYAAFTPFNESSRVFEPFVELLRARLQPREVILDVGNRSGFTGEYLAGLFPEQRVISIWEGPRGALGLRGFAHWFSGRDAARNLTIILTSPGSRLPLPSESCSLVHAYDALHRYTHHVFLPELARVARRDAPICFPHVHLESPHAPSFEREGRLRSASEWASLLPTHAGPKRRVFIFGEATLFHAAAHGRAVCRAEELVEDYNAFIALLPSSMAGAPLPRLSKTPAPADALVPNPLLAASPVDGSVTRTKLASRPR
ncbi:MAG: hypothetical protein HYV07_22820 [Deltaproteobacteria bacterium]|nr:hypothetical protein [Deltaproteobacteria bacterium]